MQLYSKELESTKKSLESYKKKYERSKQSYEHKKEELRVKDEKIQELIVQLRSKMQSTFRLNLYLYFVLEGYNEYTMQQDQVLLNKNGIKIELPSALMSGPHARKEQEIYINRVLLRHMWSRQDQKVEFWKFYANCELQIYICELP